MDHSLDVRARRTKVVETIERDSVANDAIMIFGRILVIQSAKDSIIIQAVDFDKMNTDAEYEKRLSSDCSVALERSLRQSQVWLP